MVYTTVSKPGMKSQFNWGENNGILFVILNVARFFSYFFLFSLIKRKHTMSKNGPILLVDDDVDECELVKIGLKNENIKNELICFTDPNKVYAYLKTTEQQPFLILCDINIPGMNGIEFRKKLHDDGELRRKSIPFIFFTTTAGPAKVRKAYEMSVQGFFEKPSSFKEVTELVRKIYDYWQICKHPNT
ncbi:MAG: response regulator [Chitinophagaceae bacterium]